MADLEERLRRASHQMSAGPNSMTVVSPWPLLEEAADLISAQTQTISNLTRALEIALEETARCHDCLHYAGVLDDLRAALSSARSEEKK